MITITNATGQAVQLSLDQLRLSGQEVATLIESMDSPITEAQAEEIMNS